MASLFTAVSTELEGFIAGPRIGQLVTDLAATTGNNDLLGFVAGMETDVMAGC